MSATELDPDIEAIVEEFSDLLRRRLYELKGAYSGVLEGEASILLAAAEKLRAAARPSPKEADCRVEISAEDSQLYAERTREKSEGSDAGERSISGAILAS